MVEKKKINSTEHLDAKVRDIMTKAVASVLELVPEYIQTNPARAMRVTTLVSGSVQDILRDLGLDDDDHPAPRNSIGSTFGPGSPFGMLDEIKNVFQPLLEASSKQTKASEISNLTAAYQNAKLNEDFITMDVINTRLREVLAELVPPPEDPSTESSEVALGYVDGIPTSYEEEF